MYVETLGRGPDIVMIHGWAMHGGIFAPLTRRLTARFRVHLVDLPGHGASAECELACDPQVCARVLIDQLPPALWLGWSLGGLVSLHAAMLGPDRVRGIVQVATSPCFVATPSWPHGIAPDVLSEFATGLQENHRATIKRFLALETLGSAHPEADLRDLKAHVFERGEPARGALQQGLQALTDTDLRDDVAGLRMPSLWISGRRDRLVPAAALRWCARQTGRGHFVEFPSGHAPFISHAAEIGESIDAFARETCP